MKQHHYFYAVPLPHDSKQQVAEWVSLVKERLPFQRWVHPEDVHITLAFLGGTAEERLEKTNFRIKDNTGRFSPFTLQTGKLGVFGSPSSPRILWTDVSKSPALNRLRDMVYDSCEQEGYELDKRPFNPHITIARKWAADERFTSEKLLPFALPEPIRFEVREFVLYRTHLDRTPKYEVVERFLLG